MSTKAIAVLLAGTVIAASTLARANDDLPFPSPATFTTRAVTPFAIEGLTGDDAGYLYTTGRQFDTTKRCPVWRIAANGTRVTVAFIPNNPACNPSGITFDRIGRLYIADGAGAGTVWTVTPDAAGCGSDDSADPLCSAIAAAGAAAYASGVPGTNGVAFDRDGFLWTGDGTTGLGRVWKIAPGGGVCEPSFVGCEEAFRIQPMRNAAGVGRSNQTLQPVVAPNPQDIRRVVGLATFQS